MGGKPGQGAGSRRSCCRAWQFEFSCGGEGVGSPGGCRWSLARRYGELRGGACDRPGAGHVRPPMSLIREREGSQGAAVKCARRSITDTGLDCGNEENPASWSSSAKPCARGKAPHVARARTPRRDNRCQVTSRPHPVHSSTRLLSSQTVSRCPARQVSGRSGQWRSGRIATHRLPPIELPA